ncbi:MAG: MerR family transcriptional regulator [Actinomycetota bacterium]
MSREVPMRMAELSRLSGVPTATIKYYVREGLLPAGETTAPNQARYDQQHLDRLSLIRALREAAGLSIATIGRVLDAMDHDRPGAHPDYLTIAVAEMSEPLVVRDDEVDDYERARSDVREVIDELDWNVDQNSPGYDDAVRSIVAIHRYLPDLVAGPDELLPYGRAVRQLADSEISDDFDPAGDPVAALRFSVLGTALFEPLILALRKLAHVDRIRSTPAATWAKR